MKKFLYVQPEYVREFKCDGSKCNARCCRAWQILIDDETFKQYSQLADAEKILALLKFNSEYGKYLVTLDEMNCPFLNENNLCRLQLKYGENFLSETCATYPRRIYDFKKFFERSLTLSCPVAAEIILLRDAPLKFELMEASEALHLCGGKAEISPVHADADFYEKMFNLQVAAISILQRHSLTLDQRLIALGFFLDKFDEIFFAGLGNDTLEKLFATYESESFWSTFPKMLSAVNFDAEKFWEQILKVLVEIYGGQLRENDQKFLSPLIETFGIIPDEKNQVFIAKVAANYERLAVARKNFMRRRSTFMENFLVNEFFMNVYPWKFKASIAKNFGVFVTKYKLFELLTFAAAQKNHVDKDALLNLAVWFTRQADHEKQFSQIILDAVPDDIFSTLETLLEP